jgi:arsenite-transporting ATPase
MNIYSYFEKLKESVKLQKGKRTLLEIISTWEALALKIVDFIRDQEKSEFIIVTIPEALGVKQTERIINDFEQYKLMVNHMIINNVIKEADCPFHRTRKAMQMEYIKTLDDRYGTRIKLIQVPLAPREIKGVDRIEKISEVLFSK